MTKISTSVLDHIVHLSPPGELDAGIDKFRNLGFHVIKGGTHAGGLTYNALVILGSGSYLELIAFTHPLSYYHSDSPEHRAQQKHPWYNLPLGWIDWAHLGFKRASGGIINERAGETIYEDPQDGGRTRPDGVVLKWVVTGATADYGRGTLPFFCEDVTPRAQRVPLEPASNSQHENTTETVAEVKLYSSKASFSKSKRVLTAVVGSDPHEETTESATWFLSNPGDERSSEVTHNPSLSLEVGEGKREGISEVTFALSNGGKLKVSSP